MPWQPSPLLAPDGEIVLTAKGRAFFNARTESYTNDVYVSNAMPKVRRDLMVIIRRDGGAQVGIVDQGRYGIRIWAPNEKAAIDLARLTVAWLVGMADGDPVVRVAIQSGPTPVADESKQPLRYIVAEVHMRATDLT